jgi:hypothetical protein
MILPKRVSVLWLSVVSMLTQASAATNFISGNVTASATWSGTNLLSGTVVIQSNVVVTIEPGVRILMNTAAVLRVEGQLLANGTSNQPITFTRSTTTTNWGRMMFVRAQPSRLSHCVIEFANSVGDHQSYYPTDCANPAPGARTYREAVVSLGTHLDIEGCTFQNLPFATGSRDGDAIAIIADDRDFSGPASAHIRNCRFIAIGQGIHSRYSPLLVEHCTFSDKRGDNDDIDMYGESTPAPIIRYNTFLAGHEDKINPTRCSAIIYGNFISGGDDHGVVLRDKCNPIVFNNIISNFTAAAISVQNQCDALIANNTIVNSGRGVRMFDHTGRHGPPYCLFPGNGKATLVNNIIWNTPSGAVTMEASSFLPHPEVTLTHCNLQNGIVTNNANCVINWGPGNINSDPQFISGLRLGPTSPCIDAGTNALLLTSSNWSASITNDLAGLARPLDGNGDGLARFDIGAYEVILASADSNGDGIPDGWTQRFGLNPTDPNVAAGNPDNDPHTTLQEWISDTDPTDPLSYLRIESILNLPPITIGFVSSSNRVYTLLSGTNHADTAAFAPVRGQVEILGTGGAQSLTDTNAAPALFYRIGVKLP